VNTADRYIVHSREKFEYNTDPQRRCYNGCYFASEWRWGPWNALGMRGLTLEEANESVESWKKIGRPTCEFKAVKIGEAP
jgi:hypothetical protein